MPRKRHRIPSLRHHKPSGQAVVTLDGRDHYLGKWGSDASQTSYDSLISSWMANGRRLPQDDPRPTLTIRSLAAAYLKHAEAYYRKPDGRPTNEVCNLAASLRPLVRMAANEDAATFGPRALARVRELMIQDGLARKTINGRIRRIRRVFRWAASEELLLAAVPTALGTLDPLERGRSEARETAAVSPVEWKDVEAVLPHVSAQVAAMVKVQWWSGMRPGEVVQLRGCDIDRSNDKVWVFRPASHKMEHLGRERLVHLGPQAQQVLSPLLKLDAQAYVFSPRDAEAERSRSRRRERKTPLTPSQRNRRRKRVKRRSPKDYYDVGSYRRAIVRACKKAGIPVWSPNQLRHAAATRIRRETDLEAARVILGHKKADVTEIYAEADQQKSKDIMSRLG